MLSGAKNLMMRSRLEDVVFGCLSQMLPEKMPAAPAGSISILNVATVDNKTSKRVMAAIDPLVGGAGGMPFSDGPNGSGSIASFLKNTPGEINEAEWAHRVGISDKPPGSSLRSDTRG
jgi:N-methylhydantoinase B